MDTVEKRIDRLPDGQFEFVAHVRDLILAADPEMTEQLHFSTPFFSCRGWLCYLNIPEESGLEVNFVKGNRLTDKYEKLVARKRKVVRSLVYEHAAEFDEAVFLETLQEAVALNSVKKKPRKKQHASHE